MSDEKHPTGGAELDSAPCVCCEGVASDELCECCEGKGIEWACPVCDVWDEEESAEEDPETRDELMKALHESLNDVQNGRTHILHHFTDFFKNELGEE